jgi:hypothetical protein
MEQGCSGCQQKGKAGYGERTFWLFNKKEGLDSEQGPFQLFNKKERLDREQGRLAVQQKGKAG